ncbi:DUF6098 family protein [Streptomyces sp. NPDC020801]|uniref:DUF6098 family protein n=1 Tax=Streptomyces sp. NPDC020801 TaxID=3365093 RepID=UPI0037AABA1C
MTRAPAYVPGSFKGRETGRGPGSWPLVADVDPLCRIGSGVIGEARTGAARQETEWGTLRRSGR